MTKKLHLLVNAFKKKKLCLSGVGEADPNTENHDKNDKKKMHSLANAFKK